MLSAPKEVAKILSTHRRLWGSNLLLLQSPALSLDVEETNDKVVVAIALRNLCGRLTSAENSAYIYMAVLKQTVSYLHATQYFELVYSRD